MIKKKKIKSDVKVKINAIRLIVRLDRCKSNFYDFFISNKLLFKDNNYISIRDYTYLMKM